MTATVASFPLSKHAVGGGATPAFSGWLVYLQFTWVMALSPSPVEFSSHLHFYKLSCSWLPGRCCQSCLLQPACLLTVLWGMSPSPLQRSGCTALSVTCLFCCCCLFSFFFSFFPGWGSVRPGAYVDLAQSCLWEYHVPLNSPCGLHPPKQSVSWLLVAREPSWFLCLMCSGDAMHGLGVWRSQNFVSSRRFFL
jgi:hypothetical protein